MLIKLYQDIVKITLCKNSPRTETTYWITSVPCGNNRSQLQTKNKKTIADKARCLWTLLIALFLIKQDICELLRPSHFHTVNQVPCKP